MGLFTKKTSEEINWKTLSTEDQLFEFAELSNIKPLAIFKHSTRCALSSMAKSRLERGWSFIGDDIDMYYLDLLNFREISNKTASLFSVEHQSPQLILISKGEVKHHSSHGDINAKNLKEILKM